MTKRRYTYEYYWLGMREIREMENLLQEQGIDFLRYYISKITPIRRKRIARSYPHLIHSNACATYTFLQISEWKSKIHRKDWENPYKHTT